MVVVDDWFGKEGMREGSSGKRSNSKNLPVMLKSIMGIREEKASGAESIFVDVAANADDDDVNEAMNNFHL